MSEKPALPKVLFGTPLAATPKSSEPKILAGGVRRERIACSVPQLQAMFPDADDATLAQALQRVNSINLDDSHDDDVARFGVELQDEQQAIATLRRTIANHESARQAKATLGEVRVLFEQLDPGRLFKARAPSLWSRWIAPAQTPRAVHRQVFARIVQCVGGLAAHENALMNAAGGMERLSRRCEVLVGKITACVLAANFIVDASARDAVPAKTRSHYARQIALLGQRAASLASSRGALTADRIANDALEHEMRALAAAGACLREELLPGFDTAFTAALASPSPLGTAVFALSGHYHRTLKFLKETSP